MNHIDAELQMLALAEPLLVAALEALNAELTQEGHYTRAGFAEAETLADAINTCRGRMRALRRNKNADQVAGVPS